MKATDWKTRPRRAIALLSGGLDSTLAIRLMIEQSVDVLAVNFVSPFCTCNSRSKASCHIAVKVSRSLGVKIRQLSKGLEYLRIVEHPRFGYGRGLNPCIDCRIFMLRKVAGIMEKEGASFVVTGEVLGQRPMSQHLQALRLIEKESGLEGLLLRPLSAHLLEPTIPENQGAVDRQQLLAIQGRSRRKQLTLAREKGLGVFGCPAGGCLLTEPVIASRLKDLFLRCPDYDMSDAKLLTFGRHFRLHEKLKAVLGRNQIENERLLQIANHRPRMELVNLPGPLMLTRGEVRDGDREKLGRLLRSFASKVTDREVLVKFSGGDRAEELLIQGMATSQELEGWRI